LAGCRAPSRWSKFLVLAVLLALATGIAEAEVTNQTKEGAEFEELPAKEAFFALLGILGVFLVLVVMGYKSNRSLNRGEMRRAVAGAFVSAFLVLIFVLLHLGYSRVNEVIAGFMAMVTTIVGFYFGSRTAQREGGEEAVGIENAYFRDSELVLSFRNGSARSVTVDAVYVNTKPVEAAKTTIPPRSLAEIPLSLEWKAGESYAIKACTSHGKCSEIKVKAPEKSQKEGKR
jgi:hypothetical protein